MYSTLMFARPGGSGRSVNLSMLDAFFDLEYKGNAWFDGLQISEHPEYEQYRNRFPVVSIGLKNLNTSSFERFLMMFRNLLKSVFKKAHFLRSSDRILDVDK